MTDTPHHVGLVSELEHDRGTLYYTYGPGDDELNTDCIDITIDGNPLEFNTYHNFEGFERLFLITDNDNRILTNEPPDGFQWQDPPTTTVTAAIETTGVNEYIKVDGEWYHSHDAGYAYMEQRNNNITPSTTPPDSATRYTITLYDPDGGGSTFWASCNDLVGSGDMPEEAISSVLFAAQHQSESP